MQTMKKLNDELQIMHCYAVICLIVPIKQQRNLASNISNGSINHTDFEQHFFFRKSAVWRNNNNASFILGS